METIIGACISGVVALVVAYFMYLGKTNKVMSRIEALSKQHDALIEDDKSLSGEHRGLSNEHKDLSKENHNMAISVALMSQTAVDTKIIATETGKALAEMNTAAEKERTAQQIRYDNLTEKQKNITENVMDTVKAFEALKNEFVQVNDKNITLKSQMQVISEENKELKTANDKLEQKHKDLKHEFEKLLAHDNQIVEKCNKYAAEINQLQQGGELEQTNELDDEWEMDR